MGREKVDIQVDANTANAIAAMMELVRAQGKIGDGAEEVGRKGASASKMFTESLDKVASKWISIHKGIELATTAIKTYIEAANKLREESVGATRTIDTGITSYRIAQGNLSHDAGIDAAGKISLAAQQTRSSHESAFGAATMLAKYGVDRGEAEGSALTGLLEIQDLAQAQGKFDPVALSTATLDALQRSKRPINGQNIKQFSAAAFSLGQQIKGFDGGEVGITANVATLGRNAGMSLEETMAVVGSLSEDYGESNASKQFRRLFKDSSYTQPERKQIAALRARASSLLSESGADYEAAVGIAGSSMTDEEAQAKTMYEASGYKPGIQDSKAVRERLITAFRQEKGGESPWAETVVGTTFDMLNKIVGPERAMEMMAPDSQGGESRFDRIRDRSLGKQQFTVRLQGPDGRDLPIQTEAEALNTDFSNDSTQSQNFRP